MNIKRIANFLNLPTMNESSVKTKLYSIAKKYKGLYNDNWQTIQKLQGELAKVVPNIAVIQSEYDRKMPNTIKRWILAGGFINPKNQKRAIWIQITASGAGSVDDPLDKYDIITQIEILSPKNIRDFKVQDYLKHIGIV